MVYDLDTNKTKDKKDLQHFSLRCHREKKERKPKPKS